MRNLSALMIFVLLPLGLPVLAGELIIGATVVEVANTSNNVQDFVVRVSGGTGICSETWIYFPEAKKQSDASYQQSFSIALSAFVTGAKVRIHNFEDDSCVGANFISITK